jgi:hypothetical protein
VYAWLSDYYRTTIELLGVYKQALSQVALQSNVIPT